MFAPLECRARLRIVAAAGLCAGLVVAGCGDADVNGPVSLTSQETLPALMFRAELPSLPTYLERWGASAAAEEGSELWHGSWAMPRAEGEEVRRRLYERFADVLASELGVITLGDELTILDRALAHVDALLGGGLPTHLLPTLEQARDSRDAAAEAFENDQVAPAFVHLLEGFDRLRSATPEVLARELIADAEWRAHAVANGNGHVPEASAARAERLLLGAREAVDRGAPVVALRRAWYAVRLLTEEAPR